MSKDAQLARIGLDIQVQSYPFTSLTPVKRHPGIVIHWMGPGRFTEDTRNPGQVIHAIHRAEGYAGIGYHGLVDQAGNYYTGRPYLHRGAHTAYRHNGRTVVDKNDHFGLLWFGGNGGAGKPADQPTPAALETLARAIAWVCLDQDIPCGRANIKGHREHLPTECPGTLYPHLDRVVARARQILSELERPPQPTPGNVSTPAAPTLRILLDGHAVSGPLIDHRGYVALADLHYLGLRVAYDPSTKTATVTR